MDKAKSPAVSNDGRAFYMPLEQYWDAGSDDEADAAQLGNLVGEPVAG
jgi:hypothetical protein